MSGSPSFYSKVEKGIYDLLLQRAGNNDPKQLGGVSGLRPWVRIVSAVKTDNDTGDGDSGLVLDSYDGIGSFESRYGTRNSPGILGYKLDLKTPVSTEEQGRGLRPRPTLTNLNIEEFTIGTRKINFELICYTKEQVETISKYLMEIRFHLLIEWGWNTAKSRGQICGENGVIDVCDIVAYDSFSVVKEKRKRSEHQYDAILCRISKVDLSLGENESFVLKINGVGLGETAEYLQTGRGEVDSNNKDEDSTLRFEDSEIKEYAENETTLGAALFAQLFNTLPAQKRTKEVKNLIIRPEIYDPANYINVDREIREKIKKAVDSGKNFIGEDNEELEVPEGADMQKAFPDQQFVRFEVLNLILTTMKQNLDGVERPCGKIETSKSLKININNTIIRAFPYMFSTDSSKCIIANTKAPNLGIEKFFNLVNQAENKSMVDLGNLEKNAVNLHPKAKGYYPEGSRENKNGDQTPYAFPCTYDLTPDDNPITKIDETFIPFRAEAYKWGWLKDVYINVDFFNTVITKPNYTMKDIYYELLNGISSAFGGLHDFQIRESVASAASSDDGVALNESQVVDLGFTGIVDVELDEENETKLVVRGVDSPFLSFDLSVDVPTSLATSAIMEKRGGTNPNTDQNTPQLLQGAFFSDFVDQVGTELLKGLEPVTGSEEESEDKNPALEYLNGKCTILPIVNNREQGFDMVSGFFDFYKKNDTPIGDIVATYAFDDINLFNHIKNGSRNKFIIGNFGNTDLEGKTNLPLGLTTATFEIHGLGGFKVGDRLFFKGLPSKFTKGFIYYVTKVSHTVTDTEWKTTIEAKSKVFRDDK